MADSASTFSNLVTPDYTDPTASHTVVLKGRIQPAAVGRPVSLQSVVGTTGTYLQGTSTDASGNFSFTVSFTAPGPTETTTLRFYSGAQTVGADTYLAVTSATFEVRVLYLFDEFNYTNTDQMQPLWKLRGNLNYAAPPAYSNGYRHSKPSWDAISFNDFGMVFSVVPDGFDTNDNPPTPRFKIPHITVGKMGIVYGHLEASIKFNRPAGAHGSAWWQSGYGTGGAEFDVVEFFGERPTPPPPPGNSGTQNTQFTIHGTNAAGNPQRYIDVWTSESQSTGNGTDRVKTVPNVSTSDNNTWWDSFHVFHGQWEADKYTFWVDGTQIGQIGASPNPGGITPASIPGDIILSLLVSEGSDYPALKSYLSADNSVRDFQMMIKYIRVWK